MVKSKLTVQELGSKPIEVRPLLILALVLLSFDFFELVLSLLAQNFGFV